MDLNNYCIKVPMIQFFQILLLGPFFYLKRRWKFSVGLLLIIGLLTLLSQVGGVILWVSLPIIDRLHLRQNLLRLGTKLIVVIVFYAFSILLIIPQVARVQGRVPLPWFATDDIPLRPVNIVYCLFARNYVRPTVRVVLERTARKISQRYPGTTLMYLDGNFPLINGFPLLPHLSHSDGKKIDLAYFYRKIATKETLNTTPSPIGYWAYEQPNGSEFQPCRNTKSWLRWDFAWLQSIFADTEVDPERTVALLKELLAAPEVQTILLEPHLKQRFRITASKVRFQGCQAARHDDHIHIQIH